MHRFGKIAITSVLLIALASTFAVAQQRVQTHTLLIQVNVSNARVFINAVEQSGTAPITVELNAGRYTIVVRSTGYRDYSTNITLNRDLTVNARLQQQNFQLQVTANVSGARVFIDNADRGAAPANLSLPSGDYNVRVSASGHLDFGTTVALSRDTTVNAELQPILYTLSVTSNVNGATIQINGTSRGTAPGSFALQGANYEIRVAAPGHEDFVTTVSLNGNLSVNAELKQLLYTVSIASNVRGANVQINGASRGTAPGDFALEQGRYTIGVTAEGFLDFSQTITVRGPMSISAELQPATATVVISIPQIYLNSAIRDSISLIDLLVDDAPVSDVEQRQMRLELTPGRHKISILSGAFRVDGTFVVEAARSYTLTVGLQLGLSAD